MDNKTALIIPDKDYLTRVAELKEDIRQKMQEIAEETTPKLDSSGQKIVDRRPDGYEYIIASYMEKKLDEHFPGWSWEMAAPLQFLGAEWIVAQGHLVIIDERLLAFGIVPPVRRYYGVNAHRIAYKSGADHTPINIIDVGNNVIAANTEAMKVAINRMTHIGHDIYGRRIYGEGFVSIDEMLDKGVGTSQALSDWMKTKGITWSKALKLEGFKAAIDAKQYDKAKQLLEQAKQTGVI